jgi:hypothetical protein
MVATKMTDREMVLSMAKWSGAEVGTLKVMAIRY